MDGYSRCGEVTKAMARLLRQTVARLPNLWQGYLVERLLASVVSNRNLQRMYNRSNQHEVRHHVFQKNL